jgi:hypothetical protein
MALADLSAYKEMLDRNRGASFMSNSGGRTLRLVAAWPFFVPTPATPTTSVALDRTSDLALRNIPNSGAGRPTILGANIAAGGQAGAGIAAIVVDLLNINGGLTMNSAVEQTTNLPTAALTRYTGGEGVMAAIILQQQVGSAATSFTVRYTNQAGTGNRIAPSQQIAGTGWRENASLLPISFEGADTGVRSVEGVTIAAASGTTQLFGVCLFKPLAMFAVNDVMGVNKFDAISTGNFLGALNEYYSDACLSIIYTSIAATMPIAGSIFVGET